MFGQVVGASEIKPTLRIVESFAHSSLHYLHFFQRHNGTVEFAPSTVHNAKLSMADLLFDGNVFQGTVLVLWLWRRHRCLPRHKYRMWHHRELCRCSSGVMWLRQCNKRCLRCGAASCGCQVTSTAIHWLHCWCCHLADVCKLLTLTSPWKWMRWNGKNCNACMNNYTYTQFCNLSHSNQCE